MGHDGGDDPQDQQEGGGLSGGAGYGHGEEMVCVWGGEGEERGEREGEGCLSPMKCYTSYFDQKIADAGSFRALHRVYHTLSICRIPAAYVTLWKTNTRTTSRSSKRLLLLRRRRRQRTRDLPPHHPRGMQPHRGRPVRLKQAPPLKIRPPAWRLKQPHCPQAPPARALSLRCRRRNSNSSSSNIGLPRRSSSRLRCRWRPSSRRCA